MDVVNINRSRRFLRERPIHVNLFDRPRLVVDLLCLEPEQAESRRGFERSDSLVVLTEGEARLRAGPQIESLQAMDAVLVPPGQEYVLTNTGAGQMTAVVILTPKPTRADEVHVPGDTRPFRKVRPDEPYERPQRPRGDAGSARPHERPLRPRNDAGSGRPDERPTRPAPFRSAGPRERSGGPEDRPRRGSTGARAPRRGEGEGPVWYPKSKPAWRPGGASPGSAGPGRRSGARQAAGEGQAGESRQERPSRGRGPAAAGTPRGRPGAGRTGARRPGPGRPGGGTPRGRDQKKTGGARRASRGQGPLSGHRGPGRSGPRT